MKPQRESPPLVFDWKLRVYRPRRTGWRHPNPPRNAPRDKSGRYLPQN
jgi:hypothetical protein